MNSWDFISTGIFLGCFYTADGALCWVENWIKGRKPHTKHIKYQIKPFTHGVSCMLTESRLIAMLDSLIAQRRVRFQTQRWPWHKAIYCFIVEAWCYVWRKAHCGLVVFFGCGHQCIWENASSHLCFISMFEFDLCFYDDSLRLEIIMPTKSFYAGNNTLTQGKDLCTVKIFRPPWWRVLPTVIRGWFWYCFFIVTFVVYLQICVLCFLMV